MAIVHVVLFEFKSTATPEQVQAACQRMLGLAQTCVRATTKTPYIQTSYGGKDNSPEGLQFGLNHGFVVHFESAEDRDYYTNDDPAHMEFKKSLDGLVAGVRVVDFEPGVF